MLETSDQFGNAILIALAVCIVVMAIAFKLLKGKGYDIYSKKLQFKVIFGVVPILLVPVWLYKENSLETKIIATFVGLSIGLLNFFTWERRGSFLRRLFGLKEQNRNKQQNKESGEPNDDQ